MNIKPLCTLALMLLGATPASAVVYQLDYVTPTYVLPPDPVEGKVYEFNFFLSVTVHESLLFFSDTYTAELSVFDDAESGDVYVNGELHEGRVSAGFGYLTSNISMFRQFRLKLDTQSLQVFDWDIRFYEEYDEDYFSNPLFRRGDIYLGWDHWIDPETGLGVEFEVLAERYDLTDYKYGFFDTEPGSWTVTRTSSLPQTPSPVPLPAGLPLLMTGLLVLGIWRRLASR